MDSVSLETDTRRFDGRFKGRRVSFSARVLEVDGGGRRLSARSGSTTFDLALDLAQKVPEPRVVGQRLEFTGIIGGLEPDGHVRIGQATIGGAQ
jgi:hypothetical protein